MKYYLFTHLTVITKLQKSLFWLRPRTSDYCHREQMIEIIIKNDKSNEYEGDKDDSVLNENDNDKENEDSQTHEIDNDECKECTQEEKCIQCIIQCT